MKIINKINTHTRLVLVILAHSILFSTQVAGLVLYCTGFTIPGIATVLAVALLELICGIVVMVESAKYEHNDSYFTTAGAMYLCPFAQPIGMYFQVRYFIDKDKQTEINSKREKAIELKKKED